MEELQHATQGTLFPGRMASVVGTEETGEESLGHRSGERQNDRDVKAVSVTTERSQNGAR